jgi:hypothetical protein
MPRPRRLSRILVNAITVASLVLCIVLIGMWARSYTRLDTYNSWDDATGRYVVVASLRGGLQVGAIDRMPLSDNYTLYVGWKDYRLDSHEGTGDAYGDDWQLFRETGTEPSQRFGFKWLTGKFGTRNFRSLRVPFWFLALASAVLPCIVLVRRVRCVRSRRTGCCPACNYDLRATPTRCPECGTIPPPGN